VGTRVRAACRLALVRYTVSMTSVARRLYEEALTLPAGDRAALAARLFESLDGEAERDVDSAWSAEIARRLKVLNAGSVRTIPWEEAEDMIFGDLGSAQTTARPNLSS